MSEEQVQPMVRKRRWFDRYLAWVLLAMVAITSWMGGSQFSTVSTAETVRETVRVLAESYERQDKIRVDRIRELNKINQELMLKVGPRVEKAAASAEQAAGKAEAAVDKAARAADAANQAVQKAAGSN